MKLVRTDLCDYARNQAGTAVLTFTVLWPRYVLFRGGGRGGGRRVL
jgi:hypothetical protein